MNGRSISIEAKVEFGDRRVVGLADNGIDSGVRKTSVDSVRRGSHGQMVMMSGDEGTK